jgi:hypothetical protein
MTADPVGKSPDTLWAFSPQGEALGQVGYEVPVAVLSRSFSPMAISVPGCETATPAAAQFRQISSSVSESVR